MNPAQLLRHFDRVAETPDAVARLRRFILDLAVRGKLVEQDPDDEPASELLARIQAAKARLVKAGEIRKPKPSAPIQRDELPIEVPVSWIWIRLCDFGTLSGGMTPSKNRSDYWDGDVVWLSPKDIKTDEVSDSELKITSRGLSETRLELFPTGSLFIVARSGILKRTFPVAINRVPAASNQDLKVLVPYLKGNERYLQIMFRGLTGFILRDLVKTGTTVQSLKYAEFEIQPFPLPPLAEQHRIVAKVDELMALCNRLEAAQSKREQRRDRLVTASLNRINQPAPSAEDEAATAFREHARFHLDHLPRLTTRPEHIKSLRQTILNLAVRGKLVEQDPSDEPASEVLKRVAAAKANRNLKEKAKPGKQKSTTDGQHRTYQLPAGWVWGPLADLTAVLNGRAYSKNELLDEGTPVLRVGNLFTSDHWYYSNLTLEDEKYCDAGDLLFAWSASFGPFLWSGPRVIYHYHVWKLSLHSESDLDKNYLYNFLAHKTQEIKDSGHGVSMIHMTKGKMEMVQVPVPPLAEQHRIVAKVDELMSVCDQLETQLTTTQTDSRRLLEAVLYEALAPATAQERAA